MHWNEHTKATAELKELMVGSNSGEVLVAILGMATNPGGQSINREYKNRLNTGISAAKAFEHYGLHTTFITSGGQTWYPGFDVYGPWVDERPLGTMAKEYLMDQGIPKQQIFDVNELGFNNCFCGADEIRVLKQILVSPELINLQNILVEEIAVVLSKPTQERYILHALAHELPITPIWIDADYTDPLNFFNKSRFSNTSLTVIQLYTKLFDAKWNPDSLIGRMIQRQRRK